MAQKWEYTRMLQMVSKDDNWTDKLQELDRWMDEQGQKGWELVSYQAFPLRIRATGEGSAIQAMNYQKYDDWVLNVVFKRPISD